MYSSVSQVRRRGFGGGQHSFVKEEFKRGYEIPLLPYQKGGILSRSLWNTSNQVLRIIPGYDEETGEVLRQNVNCDEYADDAKLTDYLSGTFMEATVVSGFGENKQTFIVDYAPGSPDAMAYGRDSVIYVFARNVVNSATGKQSKFGYKFKITDEVRRWVTSRTPDGKILPGICSYAKPCIFMQALVFVVNGRPNSDMQGNTLMAEDGSIMPLLAVVSIEGTKTKDAFLRAMVEPLDPGQPLDALTNNKYGGMAELDGNKLFLNAISTPGKNGDVRMLKPSVQEPGKGWTASPYPITAEQAKQLWHPWNDLIQYMTAAEQCQYLASEFGADAVNYFIGLDPIYRGFNMPEEIAKQGYGRFADFVEGTSAVPQSNVSITRVTPLGASPTAHAAAATKSSGLGLPKTSGLGGSQLASPVQPRKAPTPVSPLHNIPERTTIDRSKILAEVSKIHAATGLMPKNDEQAAAVADILNDPDIQGDMPVEGSDYAEQDQ